MQREIQEELVELKQQGKNIYSYSKLTTLKQCPYQAYLAYIKKEKDIKENIWGYLGGKIHDNLELVAKGEIEESVLPQRLENDLFSAEVLDIHFPKDIMGRNTLKQNWISNMMHFCKTFKKFAGEFNTEEFILLKYDDNNYIQGYIDLVKQNDDGSISIIDWKTSSLYKGEALETALHQLILYAIAKEKQGYIVKDVSWVFLKYAVIEYMGYKTVRSKNKTLISKTVERRKIAAAIGKEVCEKLKQEGLMDLHIEALMDIFHKTQTLHHMPESVQKSFIIKPYIKTIEYTDENKQKTKEFLDKWIKEFQIRGDNKDNYPPLQVEKDTFFCNNLCSYAKHCEYIEQDNEMYKTDLKISQENTNDMLDLFG